MGPIGCPETSISSYYSLSNNPEERSSNVNWPNKSRTRVAGNAARMGAKKRVTEEATWNA
jgi:hypothetical protein